MSRSSAAATAQPERRLRRPPGPAVARRVSGPAYETRPLDPRPRPRLLPSPRPGTAIAGGARAVAGGGVAIASRAAGLALGVSGSRAMDRLVRSRAWIVIVGFGLIGIVTMQVSMLKLNAGIGRAVDATATLDRSNSTLRTDISQLTDTDRIQRLATAEGFVMPAPIDVHYVRAGNLESDGLRAVQNMRAPQPGAGAPTPNTALPAPAQPDSAVVQAALAPTTTPAATASSPGASQSTAAAGGTAPAVAPSGAQSPPPAGGTPVGAGAPSSSSGGVAPPTASATATGP